MMTDETLVKEFTTHVVKADTGDRFGQGSGTTFYAGGYLQMVLTAIGALVALALLFGDGLGGDVVGDGTVVIAIIPIVWPSVIDSRPAIFPPSQTSEGPFEV